MPTKARITREKIVEGAFDLIRAQGHEALTARALAARLGCSTQPLLYHFPGVEAILDAAYARADAFHTDYILSEDGDATDPMLGIGLRYIRFAAEEPRLFRFLFQSNRFQGRSLRELIASPEVAPLLAPLNMAPDQAWEAFELLFVAVHGCASLLANNAMRYDPDSAKAMLLRLGEAVLGQGTEDSRDEAVQKE